MTQFVDFDYIQYQNSILERLNNKRNYTDNVYRDYQFVKIKPIHHKHCQQIQTIHTFRDDIKDIEFDKSLLCFVSNYFYLEKCKQNLNDDDQ